MYNTKQVVFSMNKLNLQWVENVLSNTEKLIFTDNSIRACNQEGIHQSDFLTQMNMTVPIDGAFLAGQQVLYICRLQVK